MLGLKAGEIFEHKGEPQGPDQLGHSLELYKQAAPWSQVLLRKNLECSVSCSPPLTLKVLLENKRGRAHRVRVWSAGTGEQPI